MTSSTKKTYEEKFVDKMYMLNVNVSVGNIYTEECLKYFLNSLANKYFAESQLTTSTSKYYWENEFQMENGEYLLEDDEQIANPYYISEEAIESAYNSKADTDATYKVVIVAYDTLNEALTARNAITSYNDTYDLFQKLYALEYGSYKDTTEESFYLTSEELNVYDSKLVSVVTNMEAGDVLYNQQFGKKIYSIYLVEEKEYTEYADITDETLKASAKEETVAEIIKNKLTTSTVATLVSEKLFDSNVVIYDPLFDALYASENEDHTRLEASAWKDEYKNLVATVDGKNITVEDFYNTLEKVLGVTTAMDYFTVKVMLDSKYADKLTDKDLEEINKNVDDVVSSFNEGLYASSGLPASVGLENFLTAYYGVTTVEEAKEYTKSQKIWDYFSDEKPTAELLYKFSEQYYNKYFDLSVKHILVTVDYNADGTADDPELFTKKLTDAQKAAYENAVVALLDAVVEEANYLVEKDYDSLTDALGFILKEFYTDNALIVDTENNVDNPRTWANLRKEFNLGLTIEDLGSVNNSTVSKYVKEFGIGVEKLYSELKDADKLNDDYLTNEITDINDSDVIKTSFGYHVLAAYNSSKITSALYTETNDKKGNYKDILVEIDGEEVTIENAYSDKEWASVNQLKVYLAQINTDDGVEDLPTDVKTYIGKFYSTVLTKYSNDSVQNILLAKTQLTITFTDNNNNIKYDEFLNIQMRQADSYNDLSEESIDILAGWWNKVLPTTNAE